MDFEVKNGDYDGGHVFFFVYYYFFLCVSVPWSHDW